MTLPADLKEKVDELVSDLACCDRSGCRCWQAVSDLKAIKEYCENEINKSQFNDLKSEARNELSN